MTNAPLYAEMAEAPQGGNAYFVTTKDGTKIRFAVWPGSARGTIILLPGRTEYIEKYGRVVEKLTARGFGVVVIDWRGQGLSDHIDGRTDLGDVLDFSHYQQDMASVLDHEHVSVLTGPRYLFSHSMGGCIALRHLLGVHNFKAAVFSAPMWHVTLPKITGRLVAVLSLIARAVGKGQSRVPTTKGDFYVLSAEFEGNELTTDKEHWDFMGQQITQRPALGLGGASMRWLRSALDEFAHFKKAKLPEIPMLVMLGTDETIVSPSAIHAISNRTPNAELAIFTKARHEIWMETPAIQQKAWAKIDRFLDGLI